MVGVDTNKCSSTTLVGGTSSATSVTEGSASVWTCFDTDGKGRGLMFSIEKFCNAASILFFGSLLLASSARRNPILSFPATRLYLKSVFAHF